MAEKTCAGRRLLRILLGCLVGVLLLCSCARDGEDETGPKVSVELVPEIEEIFSEGGSLLYRGQVSIPVLTLPDCDSALQEKANASLLAKGREMIACPYSMDDLCGRQESDVDFEPYTTQVTVTVTRLDGQLCSVLFYAELCAGGIGSECAYGGITVDCRSGSEVGATEALGISEENWKMLYEAAFAEDMKRNPQYYDNLDAGLAREQIDVSCFCVSEDAVMIWMPNDTVSIGASPLLTLNREEIYALIGVWIKNIGE